MANGLSDFLSSLFSAAPPANNPPANANAQPPAYDPASPYTSGTGSLEEDRRRYEAHVAWQQAERQHAAKMQADNKPYTFGDLAHFFGF